MPSGKSADDGSSPHTRGAPRTAPYQDRTEGIIPAYAGSTGFSYPSQHSSRGSSPHTRGARPLCDPEVDRRGIIPAYAGSTPSPAPRCSARGDHPRIRGEHTHSKLWKNKQIGSSPHTRGALLRCRRWPTRARIIPAYAGSTGRSRIRSASHTDHPRIRGEHGQDAVGDEPPGGSSPHTRGAPFLPRGISIPRRIIPAYAGSTVSSSGNFHSLTDHPRIRGEHRGRIRPGRPPSGSSPHTRGARPGRVRAGSRSGIIPAYAGSTWASLLRGALTWDHPRIRGEHLITRDELARRDGIIPAYAGSTPPSSL